VYLSDVLAGQEMEQAFRKARWFTRSWTLQELLAPKSIEFLNCEGERIGDKSSMMEILHEITHIPVPALQGAPMSQFSVEERISWAQDRTAARGEDEAYALLGIFDIHMPPLYGEGRGHAFTRLLKDIRKESILQKRVTVPQMIRTLPVTNVSSSEADVTEDSDSDDGSEVDSVFSDGGLSTSSASTASLNPVHTAGIRELSRALLSREESRAIYTVAVNSIDQRKSRLHIRGYLKEYGRDLLKEASQRTLEIQAAKFVMELAGRIADEIRWNITGFEVPSKAPNSSLPKKDLEAWLSSLESRGTGNKDAVSLSSRPTAGEMFQDEESEDEPDDDLVFPSIDKVKDFLLNSEAFQTHITAMRTWLKVDRTDGENVEQPVGKEANCIASVENIERQASIAATSSVDGKGISHEGFEPTEMQTLLQEKTEQGPDQELPSRSHLHRNRLADLTFTVLEYWGISFVFYDIIDLFVPRVPRGYRRLRWRCVSS
jgi:hypothetical protein